MTRNAPRSLQVGLVLPHWTALPVGSPWWWATETPTPNPDWSQLLGLARQAEDAGFDSLWTIDHLLLRMDPAAESGTTDASIPGDAMAVWECWSVLAALAASTTRIALGPMVSCANFRHPALLAKIAQTVDDISGGRVILGIGAGDIEDEHLAFGMRWDHRVSRFAEAVVIVHDLLRTGLTEAAEEYFHVSRDPLLPSPKRAGQPPILIGALEHRPRMLELVARYADIWTTWLAHERSHPDRIPALREAVDTACHAVGRDPATLKRSVTVGIALGDRTLAGAEPLTGSPSQLAESLRAFQREGIDLINVWLNPMTSEGIEQLAEVLPLLSD